MRIERQVFRERDGCAVSVILTASVSSRIPAGEFMACPFEHVRRERGREGILNGLLILIPAAVIGIKGDRMRRILRPARIKHHHSPVGPAQVVDGFPVTVIGAGAVRFRVPAKEAVPRALIAVQRQRLGNVISKALVRHGTFPAVGVKVHRITDSGPAGGIDPVPGGAFRDGDGQLRLSGDGFVPAGEGIAVTGRVDEGDILTLHGVGSRIRAVQASPF